jgi:hypothetical protein
MLFVDERLAGMENWIMTVVRFATAPAVSVKLKYAPGSARTPSVNMALAYDMLVGGFAATAMRTGSVYMEIVLFTPSVELDGMNARGTVDADAASAPRARAAAWVNITRAGVYGFVRGRETDVERAVREGCSVLNLCNSDAGTDSHYCDVTGAQ